jgi:hypothetical protein
MNLNCTPRKNPGVILTISLIVTIIWLSGACAAQTSSANMFARTHLRLATSSPLDIRGTSPEYFQRALKV